MHSPTENNRTSPKRRRNYSRRRLGSGHSRATMAPQASSPPSYGTSRLYFSRMRSDKSQKRQRVRGEPSAVWHFTRRVDGRRLESMLAALRQCRDGERVQLRPRVPPANNDAASVAEDGIHEKIGCMESDMRKIEEDLAGLIDVRGVGPKIVLMENDLNRMKELVSLSNVRETAQKIGRMESDLGGMKRDEKGADWPQKRASYRCF